MALTVTDLSRRIDDKWVLRDVSLEAEPGQILGVFGPSGSGKTALFRLLAGLDLGGSGQIHHNGREISRSSSSERAFHFPVIPNGRFWQNIFGGKNGSKPVSGEIQLKAFEKTIADVDSVLLLDNPFCSMDLQMKESSIAKLHEAVRDRQLTVVLFTSDYDEIFDVCDMVSILIGGEIKQTGVPQEVYDLPKSSAVAAIVGRNNIFLGRRLTSSKSDLPEFQTIEGEHRLFTRKADVATLGAINSNVPLAIRPESIVISLGAAFPEDNLIKAVITDVRPHGPATRVFLESNGLRLEALVLRLVGLNVGDECMLGLPPDRIQMLKTEVKESIY